jgi:dihydroxyacetone kinase
VSGAEVKEAAGAAADVVKEKANDVKAEANKKADEIKPKVNEAVNNAKETGMYFQEKQSYF